VGRPAGSQPDFARYSAALKASNLLWTEETLDKFLVSPMAMVPGTFMPMLIPDDKTRADVVGYLSTLKTDEAAATVPDSTALTGPQVYNEVCIACHSPPGLGGAPALGDAAAWAPRIALGVDTLLDHALTGFSGSKGIMPKKGGRLDLSDEEIIAAVRYMVERAAP
jgi:cytochrome c5